MTDQRDKTSNGTQNPIPRTATAGELLAVKNIRSGYLKILWEEIGIADRCLSNSEIGR